MGCILIAIGALWLFVVDVLEKSKRTQQAKIEAMKEGRDA
jgi:hypothetical protein